MTVSFLLFTAVSFCTSSTQACFGPKIYFGIGEAPLDSALYAVVSLYLKEKTGVESLQVELGRQDAVTQLEKEKIDLARTHEPVDSFPVLLSIEERIYLLASPRLVDDLQFSTVAPALKKLGALLHLRHLDALVERIKQGRSPAAEARRFLMDQGWI